MNDQLVRAMTKDGFVKAVAVTTKTLTGRSTKRSPPPRRRWGGCSPPRP